MKMTRRTFALLIAFALLVTMAVAGGTVKASAAQMVNPMKEVTFDEMVEASGVPLYAPEGAEEIRYFTITANDMVIAQMDFTLDGKAYTYRASDAELDVTALSGVYFANAAETDAKVSYAEGKLFTEGNTAVLFWEDRVPGVCYSLSCTECEDSAALLEIAENAFRPLQGDDDGIVSMVNPMKEVTFEEMVEASGVPLYAPEGAEDIRYFTITGKDMVIGQMDFTLDGKAYTYRAAGAELDATILSGVYFTNAAETDAKVSYANAKLLAEGNTAVLFWEDKVPGVCYSLSCTECEVPAVLLEIAENTFRPLQDSDDVIVEYPDLGGTWTAEDYSFVTLTEVDAEHYDALVSIYRLTQFTGVGELDTVSMKLTLEDPNGNTLYAEFHHNEDNTGTLVITESDWSLLESGTEFDGFVRNPAVFAYEHDPRENPAAMADIIENPDAVYGFSPNPESKRLGTFADYDWTSIEMVRAARLDRIAYHESLDDLYFLLSEMRDAGCSIEEMARVVSAQRNRLRLASYRDDPEGLEKVKQSNLETYGNENGPTADSLYEKYGSWETVIQKAFGTNPGMDACVGLYDEYYTLYIELGMIQE